MVGSETLGAPLSPSPLPAPTLCCGRPQPPSRLVKLHGGALCSLLPLVLATFQATVLAGHAPATPWGTPSVHRCLDGSPQQTDEPSHPSHPHTCTFHRKVCLLPAQRLLSTPHHPWCHLPCCRLPCHLPRVVPCIPGLMERRRWEGVMAFMPEPVSVRGGSWPGREPPAPGSRASGTTSVSSPDQGREGCAGAAGRGRLRRRRPAGPLGSDGRGVRRAAPGTWGTRASDLTPVLCASHVWRPHRRCHQEITRNRGAA